MLKNYFIIAFRNLIRQKSYSIINIAGLSIGLMACLLIVLFIYDEFQYDRHHSKGENIYRMIVEYKNPAGDVFPLPLQAYRLKDALETDFPEMEGVSRVTQPYPVTMEVEENKQKISISAVDDDFFNIFDVEMIAGDINTALKHPDGILLSESSARKLFGHTDIIGEILDMYTPIQNFVVKVTGVYRDFPRTSHFHLDGIFSTRITDNIYNERQKNNWGEGMGYVYVYIPGHVDIQSIEKRFPEFVEKHQGEGASEYADYSLQPLFDIHLRSHYRFEIEANSDIRYVYIFGMVALFILLIAAFNYMNLSTARSIRRSKEVGIRKVTGATRRQLVMQFIGESIVYTFIALWLAVILSELFLPYFNRLSGKELGIDIFNNWKLTLGLILASVIIGILAGSYPAFFLSGYKPVNSLSGATDSTRTPNVLLRKSLVVLQFSISIALIISTLVVFLQWKHMSNAKLGINPENVLVMQTPSQDFRTFKEEIMKDPGVISVSALNKRPTRELSSNLNFKAEGLELEKDPTIKIVTVDWDFFETIGNRIVNGRSFSKEFGSDERDAVILNEAAVDFIGWDEPLGKWFQTWTLDSAGVKWIERKGNVIGVAENFYFESLHNEIQPVVYFIQESWINWMIVKVSGNNMQKTISHIRDKWNIFNEDEDFSYTFYEQDIQNLYMNEKKIFRIFISFAILAIFIASLGILGLVSFTAEQRTKEIGIRKTMGASISRIISLLTLDFLKLVVFANILAWPIAWYFMDRWLQDFPVRIKLGVWVFLISAVVAVLIALGTTFYQAWRAATGNPAKALKYE